MKKLPGKNMPSESVIPNFEICAAAKCSGCSACASICPADAITMTPDVMGFLYPEIDFSRCTDCGLCRETCPVVNLRTGTDITSVYAAQAKDTELLQKSASGGIFGLLARKILAQRGKVYGAAYADHFRKVRHRSIESLNDLDLLLCSKYLQSDTADTYSEVKADLKNGRKVLYSGTPCQIAGLKAFLGKDDENLLCVEILCHGVPSPAVWKTWLESVCPDVENITSLSFRNKKHGWQDYALSFRKKNGEVFFEKMTQNAYMFFFLRNCSLRESCGICPFHRGNSQSDLTLGDYWQFGNELKKQFKQVDHGISAVLIRTKKGAICLEQLCPEITLTASSLDHAAVGNPVINYSADLSLQWDEFRSDFAEMTPVEFLKKWGLPQAGTCPPETFYKKLIRNLDCIAFCIKEIFICKNVLILTQPLRYNYGGILQAYALQTALRKMGIKAVTYRSTYKQPRIRLTYWRKLKHMITGAFRKFILRDREAWLRPWIGNRDSDLYYDRLEDEKTLAKINALAYKCSRTSRFVKKHIRLTDSSNDFRYYIVGSDQVWRKEFSPHQPTYFLDFLPEGSTAQRISYAASFGLTKPDFSEEEIRDYAVLLQRFNAVSVREESGVKICRDQFGVNDAVVMPDPTMLLTRSDYQNLFTPAHNAKPTLFCYILDDNRNKLQIRQKISRQLNLEIVLFELPEEERVFAAAGVEDWLQQLAAAEFVVADSFHGIVFALIFNKPFLAIGNIARGLTRFQSLMKCFNTGNRLILSPKDITEELLRLPLDTAFINDRLAELRQTGCVFLQKNLKRGR